MRLFSLLAASALAMRPGENGSTDSKLDKFLSRKFREVDDAGLDRNNVSFGQGGRPKGNPVSNLHGQFDRLKAEGKNMKRARIGRRGVEWSGVTV